MGPGSLSLHVTFSVFTAVLGVWAFSLVPPLPCPPPLDREEPALGLVLLPWVPTGPERSLFPKVLSTLAYLRNIRCTVFIVIAGFGVPQWLVLLAGRHNLSHVVSWGVGHFTCGLCPQGRVTPLSPSLAVLETIGPNCRNVPSLSPISYFQPLELQVESPSPLFICMCAG